MIWKPMNLTEVCPANSPITACSYFGFVYLDFIAALFGDSVDRRIQEKLGIGDGEDSFHSIPYDRDGARQTYERVRDDYDFIVVGAGTAGCVVANRLVGQQYKVLLLEAGGEQPDITLVPGLSTSLLGSSIDWKYYTKRNGKSCLGREGQRCSWPRGKTMGGSSSINSMSYVRGCRVDYDDWAAAGNVGWSYDEILPYFKKSENNLNIESLDRKYHGVGGEQSVSCLPYIDKPALMMTQALIERGVPPGDFNGADQLTTMQGQTITGCGARVSANTAFIQSIRYKNRNLTVIIKTEVTKILIDVNKRAYGVVYVKNGIKYTALAKKEVIVSAGVINSPKLLMLSGVGPRDHLESLGIPVIVDSYVGYNLHDHVTFNGYTIALPKENSTLVDKITVIKDILDYKLDDIKNGPISGNGVVNTVAFIKTDPNLPAADIQYQCYSIILKEYLSNPTLFEAVTTLPTAYYDGILPRTENLVPKSRGRIYLNDTDPNGYPTIDANYLDNELDFIPILKGIQFILGLENTKAFKDMGAKYSRKKLKGCRKHKWGSDNYTICLLKRFTSSTYHPVGTCKMGPNWDPTAVVDPRLRVYGVGGLRVVDSSIMPVIVRGNTVAPSMMIGEKGADMLLEDWGAKKC